MTIYLVASIMLRREAEDLVIRRTTAVSVLMRALADSIRAITMAFGQVQNMRSANSAGLGGNTKPKALF